MLNNITFLTLDIVIEIQRAQINKFGGCHGVRSLELLESAINEVKATFLGEFLYESLFDMAAAYMFNLIKNHPFYRGK